MNKYNRSHNYAKIALLTLIKLVYHNYVCSMLSIKNKLSYNSTRRKRINAWIYRNIQ